MPRKKTHEQYVNECKSKGYDLPIEEYKGTNTKIKHKCTKCNKAYKQKPTNHLRGCGCPYCSGRIKIYDKKYYYLECKSKGYDLPIEEYKGTNTKIKHKCTKCNKAYKQKPTNHLRGCGCPYCSGRIKRYDKKYYLKQCIEKGIDLPIEEYKRAHTKIKHKCSKCGNVYEQRPNSHLRGQGCPKCKRVNYDYYYNLWLQNNVDLPTKEQKINSSIDVIEFVCSKGHKYMQQANQHKFYGCPICSQSHGERFIKNYLDNHNIVYEPQKRFHDLKDKTYLSYDFYLPKQNVLIEYQGQQHYEECSYFGGEERFKIQQYHDKLKREYSKKHGYTLLELTYKLDTQDKVNDYLDKNLNN